MPHAGCGSGGGKSKMHGLPSVLESVCGAISAQPSRGCTWYLPPEAAGRKKTRKARKCVVGRRSRHFTLTKPLSNPRKNVSETNVGLSSALRLRCVFLQSEPFPKDRSRSRAVLPLNLQQKGKMEYRMHTIKKSDRRASARTLRQRCLPPAAGTRPVRMPAPQTSTAARFTDLPGRRENPGSCAESAAEFIDAQSEATAGGWQCFGAAREPYRSSGQYAAYIIHQVISEYKKSTALTPLSLSGRGFAPAAVSGEAGYGGR